ncbi:polyketide synthase/peptide synthetase [Diaporthe helianthi]|uniref:Polyketide synthase 13 n=1 Tax=Diaporthe helianthi TaxID=158607 RepID=A0A1I9KHW1_DIAHE|nr:polyketide synthase 13 [Diaporthe helianthi]POS79314.1 polyketide synthase/peptide synthetase [Diaporthe helianthi]
MMQAIDSFAPKDDSKVQEPIAIVGSACRFPGGASNPSKLWDLLREPRDVLRKIPEDRFNPEAFYHADGAHHGTSNVTESYLLEEDPRVFDAGFFNIKPVEAHATDPQHRILLETVYEALESAGLPIENVAGSQTAVFVGQMWSDYNDHLQRDMDSLPTYAGVGTARSILSNRISHFFDWHGPSATIDTACSSSLVAVYNAVLTLRNGDSPMAVVAGANVILTPEPYIGESKLKMLSHDSRSRMWDEGANGYARGDGVAALILKPLSKALADGDHVESVIRECLVNQDGRTAEGITVPSSEAQAELIQRTYAKAGLDALNPQDRCQFFEAHGTGTGAGDPREARAIATAFFGQTHGNDDPTDKMYVGSIKTIIGHTEGTAGIAGIMKASLAVQNGRIPPNLLFNRLSPAVAPFYNNLEIPVTLQNWPAVPHGTPRRASINSFGFGGTNAHVILESFEQTPQKPHAPSSTGAGKPRLSLLVPFVFSASSEKSLKILIDHYVSYLDKNRTISLADLWYTLSRRSALSYRVSFPAQSVDELLDELNKWLQKTRRSPDQSHCTRFSSNSGKSRILGVFTGQGAQWATMGKELITEYPQVQSILSSLDQSLGSLPRDHRPQWSIMEELLADPSCPRVHLAAFSQPLCTAVQIVLVDLLRASGVNFNTVVGHSSGEIAAAYAAGFITASSAIRIAYYRGRAAALAGKNRSKKGAMMAIGTTLEDAEELCQVDTLEGRIWVAAVNSPSSITLSGDADAIQEARLILEDEGIFARLLKVDTAYHSEHMLPCVESYLRAMTECDVSPQRTPTETCTWFSSVYADTKMQQSEPALSGMYWCDNMTKPVLLENAVKSAWEKDGPFDVIVEVGAHPALKSPVLDTLQVLSTKASSVAYTGLLSRNKSDILSFTQGIGNLWQNLGHGALDLATLERWIATNNLNTSPQLLKNLPSYTWDHDRIYWHESRLSRAYRTRKSGPHPLLGTIVPDGLDTEMRWRNLLRVSEVPWVKGHTLQGQVVFPAAGYIVTAMEAAVAAAGHRNPRFLAVNNVVIHRALTLEDDVDVETLVSFSNIRNDSPDFITAEFRYHALLRPDASNLTLLATASVELTLEPITASGSVLATGLPVRSDGDQPNLLEVDTGDFYDFLDEVGYGYTGPFRALHSMKRKLDYSTGRIEMPEDDWNAPSVMIHPSFLDASFQAIFLAMGWPRDAGLVEVFVPTEFQSIKVDVANWKTAISECDPAAGMVFDSRLRQLPDSITGDVDVFSPTENGAMLIQVENIKVVPFSPDSAASNRNLYAKTLYCPVTVDGIEASGGRLPTDQEREMAWDLERVGIYFLRVIEDEFSDPDSRTNIADHHRYFFDFIHDILSRVSKGTMPYAKEEWLNDTWNDIAPIMHRYPDSLDLQLMRKVGSNMSAAIRGEVNMVEVLFQDDFMDRFYAGALGLDLTMHWLGRIAVQLTRRHPHMKMLELGAGTGGATKSILEQIGGQFSSYTFTDISAGFFSTAMDVFNSSSKMIFKTLDAERDVVEQGFQEGYYDLVIASNVLHATAKLDDTLRNARRLLKPGGYLLVAEVTCADVVRVRFPFSALPGWFRGHDDGRPLTATIDTTEWHQRLCRTGFSGVDTVTPEFEPLVWPSLIMLSQAVDDRVQLLRQPLYHQPSDISPSSTLMGSTEASPLLILVGGQTMQSCSLIGQVSRILAPWFQGANIIRVRSLRDLSKLPVGVFERDYCVINFADLESPALADLTDESFAGLKKLVERPKCLLWITSGCRDQSPQMNMSVGLGRVLIHEIPGLQLQFLDLDAPFSLHAPRVIAENFLRLKILAESEREDSSRPLLWAREYELIFEDDVLKVPRIAYDAAMNQRYTASRKLVVELTDAKTAPVHLGYFGTSWKFHKRSTLSASSETGRLLKVSASSATTCYGGLYAALADQPGDIVPRLALSTLNGSFLSPEDLVAVVSCDFEVQDRTGFLSSIVLELQAASILDAVSHGSTVLLHEPNEALAVSVLSRASGKNIRLICTASARKENCSREAGMLYWVQIEPHSSIRTIRSQLPSDVMNVIDCVESENAALPASLLNSLPRRCSKMALSDLVHRKPTNGATPLDILRSVLGRVSEGHDKRPLSRAKSPKELDLSKDLDYGLSKVIDWSSCSGSVVPAVVRPVIDYLSFKPDRTYVLFGLTSDLGQSLCDWMLQQGARHLAMTSRSPKVDPRWLQAKEKAGVEIRVFANDITDETALRSVVDEIRSSMPPIAGIANGAMVLRDKLFMDMPIEAMTETLHTKVKGSIYLDSIFGATSDFDLDFFVFFSSIAAVTGNRAQSNYSAANMFMSGLAANRRMRGLPASVMHIGAIMGVGYMARNLTRSILDNLWNAGATWISEKDFHNCFAEAVLASIPGNGVNDDFEFIVGLRQLIHGHDSPDNVLVMEDPRFSHLVTRISTVDDSSQASGARKSTSVKHLLKSARTPESIERIVRDGFITKLVTILQLDPQIPEAEILGSRADELGVDSLVSVDFRTWFSKEMSVEMPILKLLGGSTVQELISFALEKLPPALTPSLGEGNEEEMGEEPAKTFQSSREQSESTKALQIQQTSVESSVQKTAPLPLLKMPEVPGSIESSDPVMPACSSTGSDSSLSEDRFTDSYMDGVISFSNSARSTSPEPSSPTKTQSSQAVRELPMSAGQSRFWFLKHFLKDKSAFNITFWAQLKGNIRVDELSKAVDTVGKTHEALRTSFGTAQDGKAVQRINAQSLLKLEHQFIRDDTEARLLFDELKNYEYDLEAGDLMRFKLLKLSEQNHILLIGYHHINMDGISLEVLLNNIEQVYLGQPIPFPIQYSEYCLKQRRELESNAFIQEKQYWAKELTNPHPNVLPLLPFSRTTHRKILDQYSHNYVQGRISDGVAGAIKAACRRTKTSIFHFLLATYAVLLNRILEVEDFCIGIADAGREMGTFAQSIGMYLNLLPVRVSVNKREPFHEILKTSKRKAQAALAHGRLPFDMILQEAGVERSDTHNPLFQAFLNYRPGVSQNRNFCGCEGVGEDWVSGTTSYDIMLDIIENPGCATALRFEVQKSLYTTEDAQILMDTYLTLLESFANDTNRLVDEPHLFDQSEVQRALTLGRGFEHISAWPETVLHRIDRIASQQPGAIAVTDGFASLLTYGGLQGRVQAVARAVLDNTKGHRSGLIGVFCEPSVDAVCALLGIMWAGFAYVPLDPTLPRERLAVLVKTAQPHLILSHDDTEHRVGELGISTDQIRHVNLSRQHFASSSPVRNSAKPQNAMAVHFTSGTTGTPKGVVLCHGSVVNVVEACADIFRTASNAVLQQTALNFDMALWQILVTLCTGGKLVIVPQEKRLDMTAITRLIRQEEVTLTIATPSEYSAWLSYGSENLLHNRQWQIAVIGGEQYSSSVDSGLRNLQLPHLRLMNFYGPSEVSFVSHYMEVFPGMASRDEPVPVGFALNNYAAYIMDTEQRPVALGQIGEVYIAGAGVCRGYLNNLTLTNQKFIDDPVVTSEFSNVRGWNRMYKTGDKGRINNDGTLSILGRIEGDNQLKIRGVRMEMEEIERAILKSSNGILDQVVVSPRGEGDGKFLVAHALLSARDRASTSIEEQLRDIVQNITDLPQVMRPAVIVPVTDLPLTIHRKVDRRAAASLPVNIPRLEDTSPLSKDRRPLTTAQHEMLRLWSRVLGRGTGEIVGPASRIDFFNLGGTSLQLIGVQAAIQEHFTISVPVADLFKKSSLEAMTALVASDIQPVSDDQSDVDWEAETALQVVESPPGVGDLVSHKLSIAGSVRQPACIIALTGSTGFVGQAILKVLLAVPSVEKVHCLAVRDPTRLGQFRSNTKVIVHQGDLRDASLCLDKATKGELIQTVDLIIHNGADVSFLKPYSALREPNVSSTKFLATELAAPRRIPITYISSAVVGRLAPDLDVFAPVSVSHCQPPPRYRDAYGASKWASEVVLENANRDLGIPVIIRRLSSVIGAGIPEDDIMGNLVTYSKKLRAVPLTIKWKGVLDFVSVEHVAQAVVADAMRRGHVDDVRYRHDCSDEVVSLDAQGLRSFISQKIDGENVGVLPMTEWISEAKKVGMKDLVCAFLEQSEKESGVTKFQRLLR